MWEHPGRSLLRKEEIRERQATGVKRSGIAHLRGASTTPTPRIQKRDWMEKAALRTAQPVQVNGGVNIGS